MIPSSSFASLPLSEEPNFNDPFLDRFPQTISPTLLRPRNSFHIETPSKPATSPSISTIANTQNPFAASCLILDGIEYPYSYLTPQPVDVPGHHPLNNGRSTEPLRTWLTEDYRHLPFPNTTSVASNLNIPCNQAPLPRSHIASDSDNGGMTSSSPSHDDSSEIGAPTCVPAPKDIQPQVTQSLLPMTYSHFPKMPNPIWTPSLSHRASSTSQLADISRRLTNAPSSSHRHLSTSSTNAVGRISSPLEMIPMSHGPLAPAIELKTPRPRLLARSSFTGGFTVTRLEHAISENEDDEYQSKMEVQSSEAADEDEAIEVELTANHQSFSIPSASFATRSSGLTKRQRRPTTNQATTVLSLGEPFSSSPSISGAETQLPAGTGTFEIETATPRRLSPLREKSLSPVSRNGRYPARLAKLNQESSSSSTSTTTRFWTSAKRHHASSVTTASLNLPPTPKTGKSKSTSKTGRSSSSSSHSRAASNSSSRSSARPQGVGVGVGGGKKRRSSIKAPCTPARHINRWRSGTTRNPDNKIMPTGRFLWDALHMLTLPRYSQWVTWDEKSRIAHIGDTRAFAENVYSQCCNSNQWTSFQRNMTNYQGWGYRRTAVENTSLQQQRIEVPTIDDLCAQWVRRGHDPQISEAERKEYLVALGLIEPSATDDSDGIRQEHEPRSKKQATRRITSSKARMSAVPQEDGSPGTAGVTFQTGEVESTQLYQPDLAHQNNDSARVRVGDQDQLNENINPLLLDAAGPSSSAQQPHMNGKGTFAALASPESEEGCDIAYSPNAFTPSPTFLHPSLPFSSARTSEFDPSPPRAAYPTPYTLASTSSSSRYQAPGWSS
ncbi:hypothetical protein IAU59_002843 [Kwoniella sp. CBS 9459]